MKKKILGFKILFVIVMITAALNYIIGYKRFEQLNKENSDQISTNNLNRL